VRGGGIEEYQCLYAQGAGTIENAQEPKRLPSSSQCASRSQTAVAARRSDRTQRTHKAIMAQAETGDRQGSVPTGEKVRFLREPTAYPDNPGHIEVKETHMSWVFLGERFVYKLKKPVRRAFLDFSTLEARRRDCQREVRLNRRLAERVYVGKVALRAQQRGGLALGGKGSIVDWLVKMRRLPSERMLDVAILNDTLVPQDVLRFCRVLTDFYQHIATPMRMEPEAYRCRFESDIASNADELGAAELGWPVSRIERLARQQQAFVSSRGHLLEQRAQAECIVEAHGDLRPEHICLLREPVIIDCLEFNRDLRLLDPVDELAYLALECERLGAPATGAEVLRYYAEATGLGVLAELIDFYRVFRACLRAKIALWHTEDHEVRDHEKWRARARDYLGLAERYAERL
jgi:aminoglycoside phosphotransferase family enzyme